ncbi:SDR family oxidoreductase [Streptomyces luteolifulvus]|uniref:SDR family oxidoreductase n=1 Tax=Streptomyces luteolifulvus TaxID=2615112 RepID=UPI001CD9BA26|nr:SDR family oxidoreductase [Streptomyces luteolifulvus]
MERLVAGGAKMGAVTARKQDALEAAAVQLGGSDRVLAAAGTADGNAHHEDTIARALRMSGSVDLVNNTAVNAGYGPVVELQADITARSSTSTAWLRRGFGVPADIGSAVVFLLSDDVAWVTGQELVVDGGVTLVGGAE